MSNAQSVTEYFARLRKDWELYQKTADFTHAKNHCVSLGMPANDAVNFINHLWQRGWLANTITATGTPPVITEPSKTKKNK
jgi:hypothetical protein